MFDAIKSESLERTIGMIRTCVCGNVKSCVCRPSRDMTKEERREQKQ